MARSEEAIRRRAAKRNRSFEDQRRADKNSSTNQNSDDCDKREKGGNENKINIVKTIAKEVTHGTTKHNSSNKRLTEVDSHTAKKREMIRRNPTTKLTKPNPEIARKKNLKKKRRKERKKAKLQKEKEAELMVSATATSEKTVAGVDGYNHQKPILTDPSAASSLVEKKRKKTKEKIRDVTTKDAANKADKQPWSPSKKRKKFAQDDGVVDDGAKMSPATTCTSSKATNNNRHEEESSVAKKARNGKTIAVAGTTGTTMARGRPTYAFDVDDADHCETPLQAYSDLLAVLDHLAQSIGKNRSTLAIYDPYYCDGGVKQKLLSLGFHNVHHENRDFYEDIANPAANPHTKEYDALITNPPYSGNHMEKLLKFAKRNGQNHNKPFFLLLPHFVYTKDYYTRLLQQEQPAKETAFSSSPFDIFFLIPEIRYAYIPPQWVATASGSKALGKGKDKTAPFPSFWYCHIAETLVPSRWFVQNFGSSGTLRSKHPSKLRYVQTIKDIPRDFKGEFDVNKKRPNPRARKKAAKKRREARANSTIY